MGIPDHLTCLLRNLYAGEEGIVRTEHGTMDWFQIGKGVRQGCILSSCLFNLCAEYIMWNAGLDEAQAGIKIARRNINNLRYADDTTFMAENEEELKRLLISEREDWKSWLKTQHSKNEDHGITSWQIGKQWKQWQTLFSWAPRSLQMGTAAIKIKRHLFLGRKATTNLAYNTQGNTHKDNSWSFNRNSSSQGGNGKTYLKWWKKITYSPDYCTQQGSHSSMKEK